MTKGRKTVGILGLLQNANKLLAGNYTPSGEGDEQTRAQAYRNGIAGQIQWVLLMSGNYAGFGYIDSPYVAGVTDESRKFFYYSDAMREELESQEPKKVSYLARVG